MKRSAGFTSIELAVAVALIAVLGFIFYAEKATLEAIHRDSTRKVSINAIHYNLREVVYAAAKSYPATLSPKQLTAMDAALLKDPEGRLIGTARSDFRYEATGCNGTNACSGYKLTATLERESDFIKTETSD